MPNFTYMPILRFKRGEQRALLNLQNQQKAIIKPLVNITAYDFNPPADTAVDEAFDLRLSQDADRLNAIWTGNAIAVDMNQIDPSARCQGSTHPVKYFFDLLTSAGGHVSAQPVIQITSDNAYISAVAEICGNHTLYPILRLTPDDLSANDVAETISGLLETCGVSATDVDLVIDLNYISAAGRATITARGALAGIPFSSDWSDIVLAAGSFPENLTDYSIGTHQVDREEWHVWLNNRVTANRSIIYGDYATIHPVMLDGLDPRTMNPSASVRYTWDDKWFVLRGQGTRSRGSLGFQQFFNHADTLHSMLQYRGPRFSFGDERIENIHFRQETQGNLETWVTIGVNHHLAEIVDRLASLGALSR